MTTAIPSESALLRPRDAARALAISTRTLWGLTKSGELPAVRIGRAVRYVPSTLHDYAKRMEGQR